MSFRPSTALAALRTAATAYGAAFLLVFLAACAPRVEQAGPPVTEPHASETAFVMADGYRLPMRRWGPSDPKAVILGLHGFNDYSNAFAKPAQRWAAAGIATYAYDLRGFGETDGRGLWHGTETLIADVAAVTGILQRRHPDKPLLLVGLSMGGAVALAGLADDRFPAVDRAALVAPATWGRATMPGIQRWALWLAAHTLPWLEVTGRNFRRLPSDNFAMLRAMARDPLVIKRTRIDVLYGLVDVMDRAYEAVPKTDGTVLVQYGRKEDILSEKSFEATIARLPPGGDWRLALYPSGYHMLLRDKGGTVVQDDIAAFATNPAAPLPSGVEVSREEALKRGLAKEP